jgi:hypothetical protein
MTNDLEKKIGVRSGLICGPRTMRFPWSQRSSTALWMRSNAQFRALPRDEIDLLLADCRNRAEQDMATSSTAPS